MKFSPYLFVTGTIALGLLLSACHSPRGTSSKKSAQPAAAKAGGETNQIYDAAAATKRAEAYARLATGISYELNEKFDLAAEQFYQSALASPDNEELVAGLVRNYLQSGENDKALNLLTNAAQIKNASGIIFGLLSTAYAQTGQTNKAIEASQTAIQKSPQILAGYQNLAEIYYQSGKTNEAFAILEKASKRSKPTAAFLVNLAQLYTKYYRLAPTEKSPFKVRATALLNRAYDLKPKGMNLQHKLADLLADNGETDKAVKLYLSLLTHTSDQPELRDAIREKLANIFLIKDKPKAVEQLEALIRDNPTKYPQAYYVLGSLAYLDGKPKVAADYFEKAILVRPDFEQAYYDLAGMQININEPLAALKTLEKAKTQFSQSVLIESFTALAHTRMKNYPAAVEHYTTAELIGKVRDSKRLDYLFYFQFGVACERNGNFADAERKFEKSIELNPNSKEALNYLGYMWADQGMHLTKARDLIERAVKLEPESAAYLDSLGWVCFKQKEFKAALEHTLKAMKFSEEPDATILDHLGEIYRAMEQPAKAREAWQKSLQLEASDDVKKKLDSLPAN